ncbi:MAG: hypothetical protein AAF297_00205 [Planctomycetota bacterium]
MNSGAVRYIALSAIAVITTHASAGPGSIYLSGDSSVLYAILPGGFGVFPNDNDTFFSNVLGSGDNVRLLAGSLPAPGSDLVNTFYNSLSGVNSSTLNAADPLDAPAIDDVDLLFVALPSRSFDAQEISLLLSYLAGGGDLFFVAEHGAFDFQANARINETLGALGSDLRVLSTFDDAGALAATTANGQILDRPVTDGVDTFVYGGQAISAVSGGKTLFLQTDGRTPFLSTQQIPSPATTVLIATTLAIAPRRRRHR